MKSVFDIDNVQAVEFISESNKIEAINYDVSLYDKYWAGKQCPVAEIVGHTKALKFMRSLPFSKKLTINTIVKMHSILMKDLLGDLEKGIRKVNVYIGGRMGALPIAIRPMLQTWCDKVNNLKNPTEDDIWQTHLAYEYVHPFFDGNGRSGRLLWLWLRYKHGFGYKCIFNDTKRAEYYPQFDLFSWTVWEKNS